MLRAITNARWYKRNTELHTYLEIEWIRDIIRESANKQEKRLHAHPNVQALQLLDIGDELQRLKRRKPHDLVI